MSKGKKNVFFFIILKVARAGINTAEGKKVLKKNQKNVGGSEEESQKQIDFNQSLLETSEAFTAKRMMGKSNIVAKLVVIKRRMHRKTHLSHPPGERFSILINSNIFRSSLTKYTKSKTHSTSLHPRSGPQNNRSLVQLDNRYGTLQHLSKYFHFQ